MSELAGSELEALTICIPMQMERRGGRSMKQAVCLKWPKAARESRSLVTASRSEPWSILFAQTL
jgi:hypothetical protein